MYKDTFKLCFLDFFAERLSSGIRYRERTSTKRLKVKAVNKLNYSTGGGLPAAYCSAYIL